MDIEKKIIQEYKNWQSLVPDRIEILNTGSASNRKYFRLWNASKSIIATYNQDLRENEAFFYLNSFFRFQNIQIPELFRISKDRSIYFQQDIGDVSLLQMLQEQGLSDKVKQYYRDSLAMLMKMQISAHGLDFSKCYPRAAFDQQSILWDLNYFKYYFLKVSGIDFDEQLLEDDFQKLASELAVKEDSFFMYRDFQARNIHIYKGQIWFIDFQGGRRGPLHYDVASLLYQASAKLPEEFRKQCLEAYFAILPKELNYSKISFRKDFNRLLLIRIVQVLGAYGYRGLIEGKPYFKNSIPNALDNLDILLRQIEGDIDVQYFLKLLHGLIQIKNNFEI